MASYKIVIINDYFLHGNFWTFLSMSKREKADEIYLKKLGVRIKTVRKERGMKQVELGYACDIEKQNMQRIEAGNTNPTVLMLRKISENLGVSLSQLLDF